VIATALAALKAIPRLVDAAERIADGVQAMNRANQERVAKERLDEKNNFADEFIADVRVRDPKIQRDNGDNSSPPEGGG
tara:strand:+ start:409 stop:645 length:237 start_codon:yes stop_codon:yes gene_type:complete